TATLKAADAVFTVSRDLQEKTIELGVDSMRVHLNYQGVDEQFCPGDQAAARQVVKLPLDREIVLWVGKMVQGKAWGGLLKSFREVGKARPQALVVLVGAGPLRKAVERQVCQLQLGEQVRLVGAVRNEDLPNWYRAADVTALSSHSEGIPNVL